METAALTRIVGSSMLTECSIAKGIQHRTEQSVSGHNENEERQKVDKKCRMKLNEKCRQHSDFPGGHPPEYYPSLKLLDFADRTGYGTFSLRWPSTKEIHYPLHPLPTVETSFHS